MSFTCLLLQQYTVFRHRNRLRGEVMSLVSVLSKIRQKKMATSQEADLVRKFTLKTPSIFFIAISIAYFEGSLK